MAVPIDAAITEGNPKKRLNDASYIALPSVSLTHVWVYDLVEACTHDARTLRFLKSERLRRSGYSGRECPGNTS